jgi:hypothetical protein
MKDEDRRERFETDRDYLLHWLIKYDVLPPGYRQERRQSTTENMIGLLVCVPLYAYSIYKMLTFH